MAGTGNIRAQVSAIVDFFEGGLSNHPADRGHLTKYGVTLETFQRIRPDASATDLKALTKEDAIDILTEEYALKPGFARIEDDAVRFAAIDYAIHSGPVASIRALQRAVAIESDGIFGPATEYAVNKFDVRVLLRLFVAARIRHLGRIITNDARQAAFAAGWLARVATILEAA